MSSFRRLRLDALSALGALSALSALLAPIAASAAPPAAVGQAVEITLAEPHPLLSFVKSERGPGDFLAPALSRQRGGGAPRPALAGRVVSALDCEHADHDIRLDPRTGVTVAQLDLRIGAREHALAAVGLSMDQGLEVRAATADGRAVVASGSIFEPTRIVQFTLSPPLGPGESTVLHVAYSGTLACGTYPEGGGILCTKGDEFSYFAHQSVIPYVFDPEDPQGATLDTMTRDIVLRVPSDVDVISTGEKVSEWVERGLRVSSWTIDRPLSRSLGMYIFAGKLGMMTVPGRNVPTTFVFPAPALPVDNRLVSWSAGVLAFVEGAGGGPLPFQRSLTLVRLPSNVADPGTATFGMTLLSESYARAGDVMHEETWAHENSHLFWGIVVPEASSAESRMMSEGLATLSQIDYSWARHFSNIDRDTYLARRFLPIGLDLRAHGSGLAPIVLGGNDPTPDSFRTSLYTLWAYYKTSATLDHLRVTVGDDAFARGLAEYVRKCSYVGCRPDDFRGVLETITGKDLTTFFERWVTSTTRPQVSIGFEPTSSGADIELSKADDLSMTLELWLRLDDAEAGPRANAGAPRLRGDEKGPGTLIKRRVDLAGRVTKVHLDTPAAVRSVAASPRHDVLVDVRSSLEGDVDFDGETDGHDLLRCTPLVGKAYGTSAAVGLWDLDERFDPRCDANGDLRIDAEDIALIARSFGHLRTP